MSEQITPESYFIISADTGGNMNIAPVPEEDTAIDSRGLIRLEIKAKCLAVISQLSHPRLPGRRLQRLRNLGELEMAERSHRDKIVLVSRNEKGHIFMSHHEFASVADAKAFVADKYGQWWVALLMGGWLLPFPKYTDSFSKQIPIADSFCAGNHRNLSGAFIRPGLTLDRWVMMHNGSGYYVIKIFKRCALIDNGMNAEVKDEYVSEDVQQDDYHIFEKYRDGQVRLVNVTRTIEEARQAVNDQPGLWLLAKWVDYVDMYY